MTVASDCRRRRPAATAASIHVNECRGKRPPRQRVAQSARWQIRMPVAAGLNRANGYRQASFTRVHRGHGETELDLFQLDYYNPEGCAQVVCFGPRFETAPALDLHRERTPCSRICRMIRQSLVSSLRVHSRQFAFVCGSAPSPMTSSFVVHVPQSRGAVPSPAPGRWSVLILGGEHSS